MFRLEILTVLEKLMWKYFYHFLELKIFSHLLLLALAMRQKNKNKNFVMMWKIRGDIYSTPLRVLSDFLDRFKNIIFSKDLSDGNKFIAHIYEVVRLYLQKPLDGWMCGQTVHRLTYWCNI